MWRYYAVAALIVVLFGSVVFARRVASLHDLRVEGRPRPGQTPTRTRANPPAEPRPAQSVSASGSWVMSALPDCFDQQVSTIGPLDRMRAELPPPATRLPPGTHLQAGDCAITVEPHEILIDRDGDRLRVPPEARLYRSGGRLTLVWSGAYGRGEIRVYTARRE